MKTSSTGTRCKRFEGYAHSSRQVSRNLTTAEGERGQLIGRPRGGTMRILPHHSRAHSISLGVAVLLAACSSIEQATEPGLPDDAGLGIAVSEPVGLVSAGAAQVVGLQGIAAAGEMVAYVSLPPSMFPDADETTITNTATGVTRVVPMIDGGFDPVPITAAVGDTLEIEITGEAGVLSLASMRVPFARVPKVVRTYPPRRKVAVLLNAVLEIVFTEPMAPSTINPGTIILETLGVRVEGSVQPSPDGLRAFFHPAAELAPLTEHLLVITTGVTDLAGDPLEEEVVAEFTTIDTTLAIAFVRTFGGAGTISRMNADGTGLITITSGFQPAWSPDGSQIAFASGFDGLDVHRVNADGSGSVSRLTDSPGHDDEPAWSPDGSQIAFGSVRTGDYEVWVMNVDGSNQRRLTIGGGLSPSWSPDGSRIAFNTLNDVIYIMNADGSDQTQLTRGWGPRWSPGGNRILFYHSGVEGNPDVYVVSLDGTGRVNLTNHPAVDWFPAWSPDASQIVFTRGSFEMNDADIYVMDADGANVVRLTTDELRHWDGQPSWRP